jgi:hypothetical protein
MSRLSPSRLRVVGLLGVLLAFVAGACGTSADAGDGFRLSASQLTATTTTEPAKPDFTTTVATALVPELHVSLLEPGGDPGVADAEPAAIRASAVNPIPRDGLNSAGVRTAPLGFVYENPTFWGRPLVLVATEVDDEWVKVKLPARPNGQEGWVRASDVALSDHRFHAELVLSEFAFRVWDGTELIAETNVVIGTDNTPTPVGSFYITELLDAPTIGVGPGGAYGPWVLSTNAYSETLELFDDGLPVIAFHGTNQPGLIGSKASNGCIRMPNNVVTKIAETIQAGTPVEIRP